LHQWYWSYEYPDFLNSDGDFVEFDSYAVPEPVYNIHLSYNQSTNFEGLQEENAHRREINSCSSHNFGSYTSSQHELDNDLMGNCDKKNSWKM